MCAEKVSFDPDSLSLNCKQSNPLEETKVARNASQNKLPALSTDFYKYVDTIIPFNNKYFLGWQL